MLYATCAPCGIGKLPIGAFTRTVAAALDEGEAGCEGDAVGEDPVRLGAGEGDVVGLAVVIPAVQAVRDRPAAEMVMAMAVRRSVFNGCPSPSVLVVVSSNLDGYLPAGIAVMSRICDRGRGSSTVLYGEADADHGALAVAAADRDLAAVADGDDADEGEPDTGTGKAARGTAPGEFLPDLPDLVLRDPGPSVGHLQQHPAAVLAGAYLHRVAGRGELDRVGDQVLQRDE
jgi:hypothetical protein